VLVACRPYDIFERFLTYCCHPEAILHTSGALSGIRAVPAKFGFTWSFIQFLALASTSTACRRLRVVLRKIGCFQSAPCAVANVKHFNPLLLLQHTVDHTIDVELVPVEKMAEPSILGVSGQRLGILQG